MDNCRDELPENEHELVESYTFDDARTGYNSLTEEGQELMNNALNGFLRKRGKLQTLRELMKKEFRKKYGKN